MLQIFKIDYKLLVMFENFFEVILKFFVQLDVLEYLQLSIYDS